MQTFALHLLVGILLAALDCLLVDALVHVAYARGMADAWLLARLN